MVGMLLAVALQAAEGDPVAAAQTTTPTTATPMTVAPGGPHCASVG
jgi:hypothetical protein